MRPGFWTRVKRWRGLIISILIFALLIAAIYSLLGGVQEKSATNQLELVENAVSRAVQTCYAVEGRYPQKLDYLTSYYGLAYDTDNYLVSYDAFASNILPDIRVVWKGDEA